MRKKALRILCVVLAVVLFISGCWIYESTYANHFLPSDPDFSTYSPFSGKLFEMRPASIKNSLVQVRDAAHVHDPLVWVDLREENGKAEKEQLERLAEHLNSFRYWFWMPAPNGIGPSYPYAYLIVNGKKADATLRICYQKGRNRLLYNNVWYYGSREFFQTLDNLAMGITV